MCGICGIIHRDPAQSIDHVLLERMNGAIHHRGPDEDGFLIAGNVGLAMRRLAIIDIAGGQQPIYSEDRRLAVVFNGELYNFAELRAALVAQGHCFATNSDTEVLVHGYEEWGDAMLPRLNGMFAFALWDTAARRLLIARDRMGEKPLYWHYGPQGFVFGSEAKCVLLAPWVRADLNPVALHHYLTLQYTPDPLTIYQDIQQLPAAHKLILEKGQSPRVERWWQLQFEPKLAISDEEAIATARTLLQQAVAQRLVAEVPLGAFLSGGIDSSILVALMAEQMSMPVKTFSIAFEEEHYSEARYARMIAERYATDHHEFVFRPSDLIATIEGVASACDEPFADPAALPLYELARQTRKHVTVALSGDGGDETLAGYRRYALDGLIAPYAKLPHILTQQLIPQLTGILPDLGEIPEDRNPITGLKRLGQFSAVTERASLVRWGSYFSHGEKLALYTDRWRDALRTLDTAEVVGIAYDTALATKRLDRTLHADHVTYLAGDLLPKTDRTTMAHAVEARAPFLDNEWVNWTARLPERLKMRQGRGKWLLTAAFTDKLPQEIVQRGKQGFGVPVGPWLRGPLRNWARERLLGNTTLDTWIRPAAIRQLLCEHDKGQANHGKKLWALLMLAVWGECNRQDH